MNKLLIVFTKKDFYNKEIFPPAKNERFFNDSIQFCLLYGKEKYNLFNYNSGIINYLKMPSQSAILLVNDIEIEHNADYLKFIIDTLDDVINFKTHQIFIWYHDKTKRFVSGSIKSKWEKKQFKSKSSEHLHRKDIVYNYINDFYHGKVDLDTIIVNCYEGVDEILLKKELEEVHLMIEKDKNDSKLQNKLKIIGELEEKIINKISNDK